MEIRLYTSYHIIAGALCNRVSLIRWAALFENTFPGFEANPGLSLSLLRLSVEHTLEYLNVQQRIMSLLWLS